MAQLKTKVKLYLEDNSKTWDAEKNNIKLINNGSADIIETWNVSGLSKPTDSQIASYETAATKEDNNDIIRAKRKTLYGDVGDQLDEIYSNIDTWKARIKSIKDANPKE
jgi:hypothetical protein|tara:strand:+ start:260 stop:586 length:327 start_codon:yes stop_codon:yes gene_type:complete